MEFCIFKVTFYTGFSLCMLSSAVIWDALWKHCRDVRPCYFLFASNLEVTLGFPERERCIFLAASFLRMISYPMLMYKLLSSLLIPFNVRSYFFKAIIAVNFCTDVSFPLAILFNCYHWHHSRSTRPTFTSTQIKQWTKLYFKANLLHGLGGVLRPTHPGGHIIVENNGRIIKGIRKKIRFVD